MVVFDNSHWTKEQKNAFEIWLQISIEMIEKYSYNEEKRDDNQIGLSNL